MDQAIDSKTKKIAISLLALSALALLAEPFVPGIEDAPPPLSNDQADGATNASRSPLQARVLDEMRRSVQDTTFFEPARNAADAEKYVRDVLTGPVNDRNFRGLVVGGRIYGNGQVVGKGEASKFLAMVAHTLTRGNPGNVALLHQAGAIGRCSYRYDANWQRLRPYEYVATTFAAKIRPDAKKGRCGAVWKSDCRRPRDVCSMISTQVRRARAQPLLCHRHGPRGGHQTGATDGYHNTRTRGATAPMGEPRRSSILARQAEDRDQGL